MTLNKRTAERRFFGLVGADRRIDRRGRPRCGRRDGSCPEVSGKGLSHGSYAGASI
jgi:hypothetical protein